MKPLVTITRSSHFIIIAFSLFICSCSKKQAPFSVEKPDSPQPVTVSTVAGGTKGFFDGGGANARFDSPNSIAVDATGNLYVVDYNNAAVRKIDLSHNVTTLYQSINKIHQATIDSSGNLYVSVDPGILYKFGADGTSSFLRSISNLVTSCNCQRRRR